MSDGGKGDASRPYSVSKSEFDDRWDAIFGEKKSKPLPGYRQSENLRFSPYYVLGIVLMWAVGILVLLL